MPDRVCALAVLSMTTAFRGGDLPAASSRGCGRSPTAPAAAAALNPAERKSAELALRCDAVHGSGSSPALGAGHAAGPSGGQAAVSAGGSGAGHDEVQSTGRH